MDHFLYISDDDDVDAAAVEELLSEFLDDHLLKIVTNPVGRAGSADRGLPHELETRYEKLKASVSKPRSVAVEKPESEASDAQSSSLSVSSKRNDLSLSTASQRDSTSSSSDARRATSSTSPSRIPTASASASPPRRVGSPPPPKSCFCGSPRNLFRSLSSKKKMENKKNTWSESGSVSAGHGTEETLTKPNDDLKEEELVSVISEESRVSTDDGGRGNGKGKGKGKGRSRSLDEWDSLSDEEFLTDLSTFSLKNQEKQLKKAVKEERRANRDAEDLVKWVKQASARLDASVIDDLLSDEDELK